MGYTTEFLGQFNFDRQLTLDQYNELRAMKRTIMNDEQSTEFKKGVQLGCTKLTAISVLALLVKSGDLSEEQAHAFIDEYFGDTNE